MKRVFDIVVSATLLVVLGPIVVATAVVVTLTLGRPIFFRQERAGLGGKPFHLIKFRTMTNARGADGKLLPDGERLTRTGSFLRSTSIDELPELLNVLRGHMSLVGPRPLHVAYLPRYSAHHARRHAVRPGITGLAQVNGRNATTWTERLDMDVFYVDNRTMWLDLRMLARTFGAVFSRRGIAAPGEATMPEFRG